jgi:hypothetical protein
MSEENSVNSDLQRTIEPFLKSLGLNVPTILDGLAILQVYAKNLALTLAPHWPRSIGRPQNDDWILIGYTSLRVYDLHQARVGWSCGCRPRVRQLLRSIRPLQVRDLHRAFFVGIGGAVIVV